VTRGICAAGAALVAAVLLSMAVGAQETTTPAGAGFRADTEPDLLGRRGPAIVGWRKGTCRARLDDGPRNVISPMP
jgi:hypothetical protein